MVLDKAYVASALVRALRDEFDELGETWRPVWVKADTARVLVAGRRVSAVLFALVVRNDLVQVEGEKARARVACEKQHIRATIDRRVVERGHRIPCEHLRAGRHVARPETRNETAKVSVAVLLWHAEDAARVRKPQARWAWQWNERAACCLLI